MPDYSQRKKLMPFVGKYVQVKGISFERNGTHAIVSTENEGNEGSASDPGRRIGAGR
jgi:hypothetical protein